MSSQPPASHHDPCALYEDAPCGLLSTSAQGVILRANSTLCSWLGYSREELVGQRRLLDLLSMGCKIFHQTHWLPLLQMQGSVAEVQLEMVHRDGRMLSVLINAVQRQAGDATEHELAVFIATDRRKYERELLAARKRAEALLLSERAAQEALVAARERLHAEMEQRAALAEQLVGIVSHDMRTPMSAITLGANLLATADLAPVHVRTLSRISAAAGRVHRLIADLLDFTEARLGGGLRVNAVEIDLHGLTRESVAELKLANPGRMIECCCEGEGTSFGDPDRLAQVFTNLVSNALTYGDPLRPITVTSTLTPSGATIRVHNFGPTIPEQLLPHIFEPLRRGEQQVKLGSRSVGLGLYIVQQIAVAHGGQVSVHSSLDEGTTFSFALPSPSSADHAS
jgi:sigma-B regulation protein RsbU (phosphoserine phosphatase)